jgi:hypothetical protein
MVQIETRFMASSFLTCLVWYRERDAKVWFSLEVDQYDTVMELLVLVTRMGSEYSVSTPVIM